MTKRVATFRESSTPVILVALAIVATALAWQGPEYLQQVTLQAIISGVFVVGLYIFSGNSGILSFGHLSFAMIGGYTGALLTLPSLVKSSTISGAPGLIVHANTSAFVAVLIAGGIAAVVAAFVALPLMRVSGLTAGLASFALLLVVYVVAQNWSSVTNGTEGLINVPTNVTRTSALGWLAAAIVAAFLYQRSRWGLRLRAAREDETAARAVGVRVPFERGLAFVLSAFFVGAGGALYAMALGTMSPDLTYLSLTLVTISMLVVGGMTSLSGAVVGTLVISVVQEILNQAENGSVFGLHFASRPGIAQTGLAVVLLVILILRPAGIMAGREIALPARLFGRRSEASRDVPRQVDLPSSGGEIAPP